MGLPTSANKTDVLRHRWMRWSVIIMHRLGLIKELIAAGFMTTDVEELPLGHPGANIITIIIVCNYPGHPGANIITIIVCNYALAAGESVFKCRCLSERINIWRLYTVLYIVLSITILCCLYRVQ